jgi:hypothetical protein
VDDLDRRRDKFPAANANGGAGAACSDWVIIGHIDIEYELAEKGKE